MGLLDAVLRRERHVLYSPFSPDECRRRLGSGFNMLAPQTPIVNPFFVMWTGADHARLSLRQTGGRRRTAPHIMRVHLVPDGSGTVIDATTELAPTQVVGGLVMLSIFGLFGILSTASFLSHGTSLPAALFPFGYGALFVLFVLIAIIVSPSDQDAVLVDSVSGVLGASSARGDTPSTSSPAYPPPVAPPPAFAAPVAPSWPPPAAAPRTGPMLPRHVTLFSPLPITECVQRIGPDSGDASSRWAGSRGSGLGVVWKDVYEVELSKSGLYRRNARHIMRARLSAQPNGTLIETDDLMSPSPGRIVRYLATVFGGWGLVLYAWGGRFAVVGTLLPLVVLAIVLSPVQYFLNRRATANQHAFLLATLESLLGATPVVGNGA
jgi:hypothetical protein